MFANGSGRILKKLNETPGIKKDFYDLLNKVTRELKSDKLG